MRQSKRRQYLLAERAKTRSYLAQVRNETVSVDPKTGSKTKVNKRSHSFTVSGHWRNPSYGGATWVPYKTVTKVDLEDKVTYGKNVPGWRTKLRTGQGVVTSLVGVKQTLEVHYDGEGATGPIPFKVNQNGSEDAVHGPIGTVVGTGIVPTAYTGISNTAVQQARQKLLQSYISKVQTFSGGKFLAELKDSIELVTHPVRSIYKQTWAFAGTVKKLGRVYRHKPRSAALALSESWLAFSFGVKPFVQDANDAAEALNRLVAEPRDNLRYVKGVGHDRIVSQYNTIWSSGGGTSIPITQTVATDLSYRLEGAFRQQPTGTENALSEFGLDVFDIAPSIWEGIPWSFFVDYFTNVSDCLEAWRYISVDQAWLISTVRNRTTTTCVPHDNAYLSNPDRFYRYSGNGSTKGTATFVSRAATSFLAETPEFHFKLPGKSLSRWLNITSLIGVINDSRWDSRSNNFPKLRVI